VRVFCPNCDCEDVVKKGFDSQGNQRYFCKRCRTSFVDRSSVPFDEDDLEVLRSAVPLTIDVALVTAVFENPSVKVKRTMSKLVRCSFASGISTSDFVRVLAQMLRMPTNRLYLMIYEALREIELSQ